MKGRTGYFMIALLLTIFNAAVTVYNGVAIWKAWAGDIWDPGLLVLLVSLGATSLVNVWVQAILGSRVSLGSRAIECELGVTSIPAEGRGRGNV